MGKTFLIIRITYKQALIHTPDNLFISEFAYYDLMQHLHDRIYHSMAETVSMFVMFFNQKILHIAFIKI